MSLPRLASGASGQCCEGGWLGVPREPPPTGVGGFLLVLLKRMVGTRVDLPPIAHKTFLKGICLQKA